MKQYEKSITSQWGEDGVLEEIFRRIGTTNKWVVDIGAWDGRHFSNSYNLWHNNDWFCIMAEADRARAEQALINAYGKKAYCYHQKVESVDNFLTEKNLEHLEFDLLCIDIDGDDYYLWKDMVKYKPRVVVIEYNQTVPSWWDIKQERGGSFGASWCSMYELGERRGYVLLHTTTTNMIFVERSCLKDEDIPKRPAFPGNDWLCHIITGYNGKRYMIGTPAHNDDQGGKHEKLITDAKLTEV